MKTNKHFSNIAEEKSCKLQPIKDWVTQVWSNQAHCYFHLNGTLQLVTVSLSDPTVATILNRGFINVFSTRELVFTGRQHFLNWTSLSQKLSLDCQIRWAASFPQQVTLLSAWTLMKSLSNKSAYYYKLWEIQQKFICSSCSI